MNLLDLCVLHCNSRTLLKDCRGIYGVANRSKLAISRTAACFKSMITESSSGHCRNFKNECVQLITFSFSLVICRGLSAWTSEILFKNNHNGAPCNDDLKQINVST